MKKESLEDSTSAQKSKGSPEPPTHLTSFPLHSNQCIPDKFGTFCFPASLEFVSHKLSGNASVKRITFEPGSRLRELDGFFACELLCEIDIPASVEIIAASAFFKCSSLTKVTFMAHSRVREIYGFRGCSSLRQIDIPASVEIIAGRAFRKCRSLAEVTFVTDSHVREIDGFSKCESLRQINIPASVEIIALWAFHECSRLTTVTFADSSHVRWIHGFAGCQSLCRVEIPASAEVVSAVACCRSHSSTELILGPGTQMRKIGASCMSVQAFVVFDDENDMRRRRRRLHFEDQDSEVKEADGLDGFNEEIFWPDVSEVSDE
jgi:hypothetical protein